jgi:hypothetical protein
MTRDEFKAHVASSIEASISRLEEILGVPLPRDIAFQWIFGDQQRVYGAAEAIEAITSQVYVDREHIWPCVDLGPHRILSDGKLLIIGSRSGHPPRPFQKNWTGREGPFVLMYGGDFISKNRIGKGFRAVVPSNYHPPTKPPAR